MNIEQRITTLEKKIGINTSSRIKKKKVTEKIRTSKVNENRLKSISYPGVRWN